MRACSYGASMRACSYGVQAPYLQFRTVRKLYSIQVSDSRLLMEIPPSTFNSI